MTHIHIHIHDAFELAFAILAVIPCILIIIIYSFLRKELKPTNYYKLELIISIFINIILLKIMGLNMIIKNLMKICNV